MLPLSDSDVRRQRLSAEVVVPVLLVQITLRDGTVHRITDAPEDVTVSGNTFVSEADLVGTSNPEYRPPNERATWVLSFAEDPNAADTQNQWHQRFSGSVTAARLVVMVAFLSEDLETLSEPLTIYRGKGASVQTRIENERIETRVGWTGPLQRLDSSFSRFTTNESQQQVSASDTSFDFVGDTDRNLPWGSN